LFQLLSYSFSNGERFSSTFDSGSLADTCDVNGKFAVLVHGYTESCDSNYMVELIFHLGIARGGCILCMDYRKYTQNSARYVRLVNEHYDGILAVLVKKLTQFKAEGFDPKKGYMFGFSFGSILAINGAIESFGERTLGLIDACDPAGLFIDNTPKAPKDSSLAAVNVQCIHTSSFLGSKLRTCTQDWLMGHCGVVQFVSPPFQCK
jgi:Lipase